MSAGSFLCNMTSIRLNAEGMRSQKWVSRADLASNRTVLSSSPRASTSLLFSKTSWLSTGWFFCSSLPLSVFSQISSSLIFHFRVYYITTHLLFSFLYHVFVYYVNNNIIIDWLIIYAYYSHSKNRESIVFAVVLAFFINIWKRIIWSKLCTILELLISFHKITCV